MALSADAKTRLGIATTSFNVGNEVQAAIDSSTSFNALALADPGTAKALVLLVSATINLVVGAGAETNTLADPAFVGQQLIINADTVGGGSRAITAAHGVNHAGNTVMTFSSARACVELAAITVAGALRWQIVANDTVTLS